jgi:hypothetical protein
MSDLYALLIFVLVWGLVGSWTYFLWQISLHLRDIAAELRNRRGEF